MRSCAKKFLQFGENHKSIWKFIFLPLFLAFLLFSFLVSPLTTFGIKQILYSMSRNLNDYYVNRVISTFSFDNERNDLASSRSNLRDWNVLYGTTYRKDFFTFIRAIEKYSLVNNQAKSVSMISLSDYCTGNDTDSSIWTFPASSYFKNSICDWNEYLTTPGVDGPSYISASLADLFLSSNDSINSYEDLRGSVYAIETNLGIRKYTVNNILSPNSMGEKFVEKTVGDYFIITDDNDLFNSDGFEVVFASSSDLVSLNDFANILKNEKIENLGIGFYEKEDSHFTNNLFSKYLYFMVLNDNIIIVDIFYWICNLLFLIINGIVFYLILHFDPNFFKIAFATLTTILLFLLIFINSSNLYFYNNFYMSLFTNSGFSIQIVCSLLIFILNVIINRSHKWKEN